MAISEQVLMSELNKILRAKLKKNSPEIEKDLEGVPPEQISSDLQVDLDLYSSEFQERDIIKLLLLYGQEVIHIKLNQNDDEEVPVGVADYMVHDITNDELDFKNTTFKLIFDEFISDLEKDVVPGREKFLSNSNNEISLVAVNLVLTPYYLHDWLRKNTMVTTEETRLYMHVMQTLLIFKERKLSQKMAEIEKKLSAASLTFPEEYTALQKTHMELKKQSIEIHRKKDVL
jgi:hypothetical protein